tara:strand:- start:1333 stop:2271 length:939 start_codon:yes stop_codon:yes gene_type:complete
MANDKYYGYSPKEEETPTKLDRVNPYEFRKGMDYELVSMGCSRLAESTPEEREKATEIVIKNLEEHGGYYSGLIQYTSGMNHAGKINQSSFKQWLTEFYDDNKMKEVKNSFKFNKMEDADFKNDKMTEPKYNKSDYTIALKEAIKKEVKKLIKEDEDKEPSKGQVKKAGMSLSKTKDTLLKLQNQIQSLKDKRKNMFKTYKEKIKDLDPDKSKAEFKKYSDKQGPITKDIKDKEAEIKKLETNLEEARIEEREMRREAAKTMMGKDIHLEILNIIKEHGISLREGADGVRVYYEIAKLAYMEGLTAGMKKNI